MTTVAMAPTSSTSLQIPTSYVFARWCLCVLGFALAAYALHVETTKQSNPDYTAMCDIGQSVSCSKVFTSRYGKGFGLIGPLLGERHILNQPNSIPGIVFYVLQILISQIHTLSATNLLIFMSILSNVGSVYLGYILYFVLEDACIVCISTYIVNALLLGVNILKWRYLRRTLTKKTD